PRAPGSSSTTTPPGSPSPAGPGCSPARPSSSRALAAGSVSPSSRSPGPSGAGVAGTEAKAAMAEAAGADVVVAAGTGWADAVRAATGPVDVVVDPVGGDRFDDSLRLLRPEGRLVVVGFAGGDIPRVKVNRLLLRNVSVLGAAWREFLAGEPGFVAEAAAALDALIADGGLAPIVGAAYPLEDGVRALQDLAERRAVGKLVLTVR